MPPLLMQRASVPLQEYRIAVICAYNGVIFSVKATRQYEKPLPLILPKVPVCINRGIRFWHAVVVRDSYQGRSGFPTK